METYSSVPWKSYPSGWKLVPFGAKIPSAVAAVEGDGQGLLLSREQKNVTVACSLETAVAVAAAVDDDDVDDGSC